MRKRLDCMQSVLEELENNHNHTWFEELYSRNREWPNDIAILYRGNEVTYEVMFEKMKQLAKAMKMFGIKKGTEIPVSISNVPEFVYILGAASILVAKVNSFSTEFAKDYILRILEECDSPVLFIEDQRFLECIDIMGNIQQRYVVVSSLTDSLKTNPYEKFDERHGLFVDKKGICIEKCDKIIEFNKFMDKGLEDKTDLPCDGGLDDEFLITYSSGSTNVGYPKGIIHNTRSLITIGRCHDPEIQKTASMKEFVIMAQIPTQSNTDIISSISDALMQGATVALEPVYDKKFYIYSLIINRPDYVVATRSFWIHFAKQVLYDKDFAKLTLPELFVVFAVGEPLEINEEKLINKALKKVKAGTKKLPFPIVKISTAGGDCEHGGLFWLVFRAWHNLKPYNLIHHQEEGLKPFSMVDVAILDENLKYCKANEYGRLVANSPCNMKEYKNNPEATDAFFIKDAYGKRWADCRVYSYIDDKGGIHMKGRIPEKDEKIPLFFIAEEILKDRKNILSCEVIMIEGKYVAHMELQPLKETKIDGILDAVKKRCVKRFGAKTTQNIMYRIRNTEESFPLTGCGKRDANALQQEGLEFAQNIIYKY